MQRERGVFLVFFHAYSFKGLCLRPLQRDISPSLQKPFSYVILVYYLLESGFILVQLGWFNKLIHTNLPAEKIIPFFSQNKLSPSPGFKLTLPCLRANMLPIEPSLPGCCLNFCFSFYVSSLNLLLSYSSQIRRIKIQRTNKHKPMI